METLISPLIGVVIQGRTNALWERLGNRDGIAKRLAGGRANRGLRLPGPRAAGPTPRVKRGTLRRCRASRQTLRRAAGRPVYCLVSVIRPALWIPRQSAPVYVAARTLLFTVPVPLNDPVQPGVVSSNVKERETPCTVPVKIPTAPPPDENVPENVVPLWTKLAFKLSETTLNENEPRHVPVIFSP